MLAHELLLMVITVYLSEHGKVSAAYVTQTGRWDRAPRPSGSGAVPWSSPGIAAGPAASPGCVPCRQNPPALRGWNGCRGGWGAAELCPRDGCSPWQLLFQSQPATGVTLPAPVATVRRSSIGTRGGARDGSTSSRRHRESIHQCLHTAKIEIKGPLSSFSLVCVSPRGGGNLPISTRCCVLSTLPRVRAPTPCVQSQLMLLAPHP